MWCVVVFVGGGVIFRWWWLFLFYLRVVVVFFVVVFICGWLLFCFVVVLGGVSFSLPTPKANLLCLRSSTSRPKHQKSSFFKYNNYITLHKY